MKNLIIICVIGSMAAITGCSSDVPTTSSTTTTTEESSVVQPTQTTTTTVQHQ